MRKALVAGSVHIDIFADITDIPGNAQVIDQKGSLMVGVGGTAYNIACSLKKSGMDVVFASALKRNSLFTRLILSRLVELGFSKDHLLLEKDLCEGGFIAYRDKGDLVRAVTASPLDDLDFLVPNIEGVMADSDFAFIDLNLSASMVRSMCKLSEKPSKPLFISAVSEIKALKLLELVDEPVTAIFLNRLEAKHLLSVSGKDQLSDIKDDTIWVVTMDREGVQVVVDDAVHKYEPPKFNNTGSFSGAGDAFATGFASSLVAGARIQDCVKHGFFNVKEVLGKPHSNSDDLNLVEDADKSIFTDVLTGLHNRAFYEEEKRIVWNMFKRDEVIPIFLLVLDVDNFKRINDTYGHHTGDEVLRLLGRTILKGIRSSDLAFRFGGEEIIILFRNLPHERAVEVSNRIRLAFEGSVVMKDSQEVRTTLSGGLTPLSLNDNSIEDAFKRADEALYTAKKSGKNRIVCI